MLVFRLRQHTAFTVKLNRAPKHFNGQKTSTWVDLHGQRRQTFSLLYNAEKFSCGFNRLHFLLAAYLHQNTYQPSSSSFDTTPYVIVLPDIHIRSSRIHVLEINERVCTGSNRSLDMASYVFVCAYCQMYTYDLLVTAAEEVVCFSRSQLSWSVLPILEPLIEGFYMSCSRQLRLRSNLSVKITATEQHTSIFHFILRTCQVVVRARAGYTAFGLDRNIGLSSLIHPNVDPDILAYIFRAG